MKDLVGKIVDVYFFRKGYSHLEFRGKISRVEGHLLFLINPHVRILVPAGWLPYESKEIAINTKAMTFERIEIIK